MNTFFIKCVILVFATLVSLPARAEPNWTIGLGLISGSSLDGGSVDNIIPLIEYSTGPWTFLGSNSLLSYDWSDTNNKALSGNFKLGLSAPQNLEGAPAVERGLTLGASLKYNFPFFRINAGITQHIQGGTLSREGVLAGINLSTGLFLSKKTIAFISLSQKYADSAYRGLYYDIDKAGSVGWSISTGGQWQFSKSSGLILQFRSTKLPNEISDLDFVASNTLNNASIGVYYKF